ncbi:hypothetical protein ME121_6437 [Methylobacterium sp. ME121]|nr:hypothetical protein ME121_6437 [Methylobacterium sp. ME121]
MIMTYSILSAEQIRRLRAYGAEAHGSLPVADHAPRLAAPAPRHRPTYDAAALAEIADGLAAAGRELSEINAAFARQRAQATADAAARAAGRLTESERSDVLRRSHAVADAAAAPNRLHAINSRASEVWRRKSA